MTEPQTAQFGGINPPQFNALRPDATLVTVGIGGNDAGLVGVALECAQLGATQPTGHACRDHYAPGGHDTVAATIEATKPRIAAVLQGIHARSPAARVAIVGYPDPLPKSGGCYPMVPMSPDDIRYVDELIVRINAMIAGQAAANDAEFIDTYADSGGHDVCTLPPTRWFEGVVPTEQAYPLHPNAKGEASMAQSALKVPGAPRPSRATIQAPVLSPLRVSPRNVGAGRAATVRFHLDRAAFVTLTPAARAERPARGEAVRRPESHQPPPAAVHALLPPRHERDGLRPCRVQPLQHQSPAARTPHRRVPPHRKSDRGRPARNFAGLQLPPLAFAVALPHDTGGVGDAVDRGHQPGVGDDLRRRPRLRPAHGHRGGPFQSPRSR